jgi:hypothetical protein
MREHEETALERGSREAWSRFQARLGDHLAAMEQDDLLVVDVIGTEEDEGGALPYLQFSAWGDGMLRGEVSSNHVLAASRQLDAGGEAAVEALGFAGPTYGRDDEPDSGSLNFHVDLQQTEADRLAVMSVRALRDVFGVLDPAFLEAEGLTADPPVAVPPSVGGVSPDEPAAVFPRDGAEQLRELVDEALTPYFGHVPEHDDDGDIPVEVGDTFLYVRVHEEMPVVEIFGCVATGAEDLAQAAFEVAVLNRDVRFVKFRLVGDAVVAYLHLPAWPFAPEHLRAMLAMTSEVVERVEPDLVARLAGTSSWAEGEDDDGDDEGDGPGADTVEADPGLDRAGMVLLQLDAESPGSVTPELAAGICGNDVDVILRLIDSDSRDEIGWRQARDQAREQGDDETADVCEGERAQAERSVALLRRALRVVVERQAEREDGRPSETPAPPRRKPRRPRRVPDPTIEEVDPEIWG